MVIKIITIIKTENLLSVKFNKKKFLKIGEPKIALRFVIFGLFFCTYIIGNNPHEIILKIIARVIIRALHLV